MLLCFRFTTVSVNVRAAETLWTRMIKEFAVTPNFGVVGAMISLYEKAIAATDRADA